MHHQAPLGPEARKGRQAEERQGEDAGEDKEARPVPKGGRGLARGAGPVVAGGFGDPEEPRLGQGVVDQEHQSNREAETNSRGTEGYILRRQGESQNHQADLGHRGVAEEPLEALLHQRLNLRHQEGDGARGDEDRQEYHFCSLEEDRRHAEENHRHRGRVDPGYQGADAVVRRLVGVQGPPVCRCGF